MSLYGALQIGVAGLDANSTALSVTSSNIANVNTVGYKASDDARSRPSWPRPSAAAAPPAGVDRRTRPGRHHPGPASPPHSRRPIWRSPATASSSSARRRRDRRRDQSLLYTRAGNFTPDATGNLRNAAGFYLMGWPLDCDGNVPTEPQRHDDDQHQRACPARHRPPSTLTIAGQSAGQHRGDGGLCGRRHGGGHGDAGLPAHHQRL